VTLWDARTGKELLAMKAVPNFNVLPLAFSPDGKRLFGHGRGSRRAPGGVRVWNARTGEEILFIKGGAALALSPDGKRLAGYGRDGIVKVWDAQTGQEVLNLKGGHVQMVTSVVFSPDGQRLVSAAEGEPETVKVWNAQTGEELLTLKGSGPVAFSPDGHRLFGRTAPGAVKIWDATPLPVKR
jgi:WD40 repeat protein